MLPTEFCIPLDKDELLNQYVKAKQYVVEEILTEKVIVNRISDCKAKLKKNGVDEFIFEEFDTLYSASRQFSKLKENILQDVLEIVILSTKKIVSVFSVNLDTTLTNEWKHSTRNALKMITYLLCIFTERFENESTLPTTEAIVSGKSKGRKTKKKSSDSFDWEEKKEHLTQLIFELMQQPIRIVWDPPVVEQDFVNLVSDCCYKLLENQSINQNKTTRDNIFCILGQNIASYNHGLSCSLKIVQMLQQHEFLATTFASALALFVNQFKSKSVVSDVIREVILMTEKDMANDSASSRVVSQFLTELSQKIPTIVSTNLSILLPLLEHNSYVLRNCALGVFTELVLQLFSDDDIDDKQRNLRDQLLDHLEDHVHDVQAFVRSRSLQLWLRLLQNKAIPLSRQYRILSIAVDRLRDKSNIVRKNTIQLITALLQSNPFAAKLSKEELQQNYEKELEILKKMKIDDNMSESEVSSHEQLNTENANITVDNEAPKAEVQNVELVKQHVLVQYLKDSMQFTEVMHEAVPVLIQLLGSRQTSDVLLAIEFFVVAFEFGLTDAIRGIRRMLLLIWSYETTIKDAVTASYQRLYLNSSTECARTKAINVVKNLTALASGASLGELTSLEELICSLVKREQLSGTVYKVLWERFTLKTPTTPEERRIALMLLAMASSAQQDLVRSNLEILVNVGLAVDGDLDFQLAKETCVMLLKLATFNKPSTESADTPLRFSNDNPMFTRITEILTKGLTNVENNFWIPFMEKAITLIYTLSDHPDVICGDLLKQLTSITLKSELENKKAIAALARLLAAVGHTALCQLMYLDVAVFTEIKRRQNIQQEKETRAKEEAKRRKKSKRMSMSALGILTPSRHGGENFDTAADEELGLAGADADDGEAEYIRKICDTQLVTEKNFLSDFGPILIDICSQPSKYPNVDLQMVAITALSKFMLVSADFCETNLQLFFTIMEKSNESVVRGNSVVSLGDLAFRFPNLIDPWTSKLYNRLSDSCTDVRYKTLTVLSHLILNDMIKVKGQISDIALCVTDGNETIANLAKLFFHEFSKKENAIYNMLPDIISRLSDPEVGTTEENFKNILKFLFSLVQKDRQMEGLVEKICQRFRAFNLKQQWRELSYCMTLLTYNHKSVQKLLENFACYANKLEEPFVMECFRSVINNTKKLAKPETKSLLEELEDKIDQFENKGLTENEQCQNETTISNAKRKPTNKRTKRVPKANSQVISDSPEFVSRPKRTKRAPAPKINLSDTEDDDDFV